MGLGKVIDYVWKVIGVPERKYYSNDQVTWIWKFQTKLFPISFIAFYNQCALFNI